MSDKKPSVIPSKEAIENAKDVLGEKPSMDLIAAANETGTAMANQYNTENTTYGNVSPAEAAAAEEMRRRTAEQVAERDRIMREQHEKAAETEARREEIMNETPPTRNVIPPTPPVVPPSAPSGYDSPQDEPTPVDKYASLSQPQINASFDVIPLPSEGKLYKNKKKAIKVAYLTASDENILTNPNLLESGEFLDILFNRKILEPDLRYRDLHVGDRNAIMIWLRSTAYGHEYPITLIDPESLEEFEHTIDLTQVPTKNLGAEPDREGYFDYVLPITQTPIKFKLLTVGDVDDIEAHNAKIIETLGMEYADPITQTLSRQIVEVNGSRELNVINDFVQSMRVGDSRALRKHIDEIESGVDMRITAGTPGGGSLNTFLPLNLKFFWPDL